MNSFFKLILVFVLGLITNLNAQDFGNTFESRLSIEELENAPVKLIPYPKTVKWNKGVVTIPTLKMEGDIVLSETSRTLLEDIFNEINDNKTSSDFKLKLSFNSGIQPEGYILKVNESGIDIQFKDEAGQYYALQTLSQLSTKRGEETEIPLCEIIDAPKHKIRGFLLDVGRNFISLDVLKEQLDIMAKYKLNVFQWHLTDRPAWRIESKAYPELNAAKNHRPTRNPGKYYTYDDIRELIAYAKERQIHVIPEIDMPGHSDAFTTAMGFTMHSEEGMKALEVILNEFFKEIPKSMCPVVHLGSDEVHIENPKEFMDRMIEVCEANEREVIVWNPGLKIDQDVIRQTWQSKNLENQGYREIDSWNSYINNSEPMTAIPKILFKPIGYQSNNNILGGIISLWPDVRLANETDFIEQNPLYPSLITYAWTSWTADVSKTSDRYLTMLPGKGTMAFQYFKVFEDYLLKHKHRFFGKKSFQYVRQTEADWWLSQPLTHEETLVLEKELQERLDIDTTKWVKANGNTIILKDRFKQGGYFPKAKTGKTVYAVRTLETDQPQTLKVWLGFETPLRANRVYTGIAEQGKWDSNGGTIWVNGKEITAPVWSNPGWKPSKSSGWGSKEDQEIPWRNEELYWTREPVLIPLKKGKNTIVLRVPSTSDYQNWMFTFAPLEPLKTYSSHYHKRLDIFESERDTENEIIFLGNSITEGGNWKALFPKENVVNRGISGDVTDGILNRIEEVTSSQPSKVFLLVGTNDMARGRSINYVLKGVEEIIKAIQSQSKNTIIYLQSILPINPDVGNKFSGHKANHIKIMEANIQLQKLADEMGIHFINIHKAMRNQNKYLKEKYTHDGLHLTEAGYKKWKKEINKFVN
ncbi:family 20 glycosylhydrolase [Aestuariibaculum sediminum]|uniref:beta-N-acetylhexosaminidase n=1 Tax=Aestuariibaculum sediminum TaxID=2770637 RepID=A0A8J6Q685_9FLAO|nr:family 20 glycosylhydrolase [Aestuariibaculum sediminum]MBD0831603.1 family 20 glycosylhydrolase [Aestuariibaculum sediminum]